MEYNQPSEIVKDVSFGDQANKKVVGGRTYELNTDTIMAGGEELARRFEARSKKKKK